MKFSLRILVLTGLVFYSGLGAQNVASDSNAAPLPAQPSEATPFPGVISGGGGSFAPTASGGGGRTPPPLPQSVGGAYPYSDANVYPEGRPNMVLPVNSGGGVYTGVTVINTGWISSTPPASYGSAGSHPNLQAALVLLYAAQAQLGNASPGNKGEYLPRAMLGVQFAITDVKMAIDFADGVSTPPVSALQALPSGVGNASSGLVVAPVLTPAIASPNMEAAMDSLNNARKQLQGATPGNKGPFLTRAMANITFAVDNSNAAVNLVNSLPAYQVKGGGGRLPLGASPPDFGPKEIGMGLLVVIIAVAIGVEQLLRRKGRG